MTAKDKNDLLVRIDERQKAMYDVQLKQLAEAQKTNGRVSRLEKWKNFLVGGGLVLITLIGWLIALK